MNSNLSTKQRINDLLHVDFKLESYPEFWTFLILWNLFECRLFDTSFSVSKALAKNLIVPEGVLKEAMEYFKTRYVEDGKTNGKFDKLNFRQDKSGKDIDKKSHVMNVLLGTKDDELTDSAAILCIVYRLRNNLFHGLKSVESFPNQEVTFKVVNNFLLSCLENNSSTEM